MDIYYIEALCVASALAWVCSFASRGSKIALFTDSLNSVDLYNSLRAPHQHYNDLIKYFVELVMDSDVHARVFHVPGEQNTIADALSRGLFSIIRDQAPTLNIRPFIPPPFELGASSQ
jgi:hypothetical protein